MGKKHIKNNPIVSSFSNKIIKYSNKLSLRIDDAKAKRILDSLPGNILAKLVRRRTLYYRQCVMGPSNDLLTSGLGNTSQD